MKKTLMIVAMMAFGLTYAQETRTGSTTTNTTDGKVQTKTEGTVVAPTPEEAKDSDRTKSDTQSTTGTVGTTMGQQTQGVPQSSPGVGGSDDTGTAAMPSNNKEKAAAEREKRAKERK